jgi:hypothetical protein
VEGKSQGKRYTKEEEESPSQYQPESFEMSSEGLEEEATLEKAGQLDAATVRSLCGLIRKYEQ